jgi:HSP20 family molecular chaperone IbpA
MNPKIYATGNETLKGEFNISYYIFEKDSSFLDWLGELLEKVLEIENGKNLAKYIVKEKDDEGNWVSEEIYAKEIQKMIDLHEKYENKGERIDIFYGKNRIYVTFRKSREMRKKFAKFVLKTKDWIKISERNELPSYVRKSKIKDGN